MELSAVNALEEEEFVALLGAVFEHSPWVAERAWQRRPFQSIEDLHTAMTAEVREAQFDEQLALLRAHPELGGREAGEGSLTEHSSTEQARLGFTRLTRDQLETMQATNKAYRQKFGFPCIVALALHDSRDAVMQAMAARMRNDGVTEMRTALEQVGHIARGRLNGLVAAK